jgi:hypothetical protein
MTERAIGAPAQTPVVTNCHSNGLGGVACVTAQ